MSGSSLTEEQLRRIEENKKKALAKLAQKSTSQEVSKPGFKQQTTFNPTRAWPKDSKCINNNVSGSNMLLSKSAIGSSTSVSSFSKESSSKADSTVTSVILTPPSVILAGKSNNDVPNNCSSVHPIDHDKIEQNRLKALAKRAEKLSKSPVKASITTINYSEKTSLNQPNASSPWINCGKQGSTMAPQAPGSSSNVQSRLSGPQTSVSMDSSLQKGPNIFATFTGKAVKGQCVVVSRERFEVKSPYSAPLIQLMKTMNTKMYDAVSKKWSLNLSEYNRFMSSVVTLRPAVEVDPLPKPLLTVFAAQIRGQPTSKDPPIANLANVEPGLVNSLMGFQRQGVDYGISKNGRVLIGDDMGLGKTIQAICLARYYKAEWPLLVVVPSSVRFDWSQQFQRWVPTLDPQSINVAVTGKDSCTSGLINILSYDLMARKAEELKKKRFQVIIMDESHLLKNHKTVRCKAALPLLQSAKRVFLLSGTPALSRPSELYTQIQAVCPYLFKFHEFGVRYCAGRQQPWGWDYTGSSNMEELQILLAEKIMIRRLKKDVLTELPDKIRQMILLDPSSIKISKDLKTASRVMTSGNLKKKDEQGALLDFFHKSGAAKIKAIKSYVEDMLEGEKKFLIFGHHGDILDGIEETVRSKIGDKYIRIDGKTSSEQRNFFCRKFQHSEDIRAGILSITAANAGLNLSSANLVVFAELFWNPGILVQAEDRAHRIGQQDLVVVQYLVAAGTSDDHIWPMIQKKLDVLGKAGLTKDNFSSAETTRLTDQRQEEITKFLDDSFHIDHDALEHGCVAIDTVEVEEDLAHKSSPRLKQRSILQYVSPMKDNLSSSPTKQPASRKPAKQSTITNLFSTVGKSSNTNTNNFVSAQGTSSNSVTSNNSKSGEMRSTRNNDGTVIMSKGQGHQQHQGQRSGVQGYCDGSNADLAGFEESDEELEQFLNDDDWDTSEPTVKKMKV